MYIVKQFIWLRIDPVYFEVRFGYYFGESCKLFNFSPASHILLLHFSVYTKVPFEHYTQQH
ncbi:MAG TPA: hypothetical protein DCE41_33395 [Cytophagales bacterium]|nr:hypothetical protein [Cytophagales bacterium]